MNRPIHIEFVPSPRKNKKYRVYFSLNSKEHVLDFGDSRYEQYKDSTPLKFYSYLDHGDKDRRRLYIARAINILDKDGYTSANDPTSPNYWSIRYLW